MLISEIATGIAEIAAGVIPENAVRSHREFRAASVVHPNPSIVEIPRGALGAWRAADLSAQTDAATNIRLAVMALAVIRRAL